MIASFTGVARAASVTAPGASFVASTAAFASFVPVIAFAAILDDNTAPSRSFSAVIASTAIFAAVIADAAIVTEVTAPSLIFADPRILPIMSVSFRGVTVMVRSAPHGPATPA